MGTYLETSRMVLRQFTTADVDNLVELDGDPDVMRYLSGGRPTPRGKVEGDVLPHLLSYYERYEAFGYWVAIDKSTGAFLGWFCLRPKGDDPPDAPELGYRLRKTAWGQGLATEGSTALIDKGFAELGLARVYAETMTINSASRRVMEKSGLTYVGMIEHDWKHVFDGTEHGVVRYEISRAEWTKQQGSWLP